MQVLPLHFVRHRSCRTSCIATAHTCARHLPGGPLVALRRLLFFVLERRNTPFARRPVPQRLQRRRRRVQVSPRVRLAFLRDPTRAHVGLPWLPLVSLRPPGLEVVHILWRRMYSTSSRLALAHSSGSSDPPSLSSPCHPHHTLSSSCSS